MDEKQMNDNKADQSISCDCDASSISCDFEKSDLVKLGSFGMNDFEYLNLSNKSSSISTNSTKNDSVNYCKQLYSNSDIFLDKNKKLASSLKKDKTLFENSQNINSLNFSEENQNNYSNIRSNSGLFLKFGYEDSDCIYINKTIINLFDYFCALFSSSFSESNIKKVLLVDIPREIAKVILQSNPRDILRCISSKNLCSVICILDYLGFCPERFNGEKMDFWLELAQRIQRQGWLKNNPLLQKELLLVCSNVNFGVEFVMELLLIPQMIDAFLSYHGGKLAVKMFSDNDQATARLLAQVCSQIGSQWKPSVDSVSEFLMGVTGENSLIDAVSNIWQPTLWYCCEKKKITTFFSNQQNINNIEFEIYADQDYDGSSTTVNYAMESSSPDSDTSICTITSLGIFAKPKPRSTGTFGCFTVRAKFSYLSILLGEAMFDLCSEGVKAFCPIISGGPFNTGLLVTCRIDEEIRNKKDALELASNDRGGLEYITLNDLSVDIKLRNFPLRTLSLYVLFYKIIGGDYEFLSRFSSALQQDVSEWLGTYLSSLWVQLTEQNNISLTNFLKDNSTNKFIRDLNVKNLVNVVAKDKNHFDPKSTYILPSGNYKISPYNCASSWFGSLNRILDTWCAKCIIAELCNEELYLLFFGDVLDFINASNKWLDVESLHTFKVSFVNFISSKSSIVGGLLFDLLSHSIIIKNNPIFKNKGQCIFRNDENNFYKNNEMVLTDYSNLEADAVNYENKNKFSNAINSRYIYDDSKNFVHYNKHSCSSKYDNCDVKRARIT